MPKLIDTLDSHSYKYIMMERDCDEVKEATDDIRMVNRWLTENPT